MRKSLSKKNEIMWQTKDLFLRESICYLLLLTRRQFKGSISLYIEDSRFLFHYFLRAAARESRNRIIALFCFFICQHATWDFIEDVILSSCAVCPSFIIKNNSGCYFSICGVPSFIYNFCYHFVYNLLFVICRNPSF
jgi:hypothetical protein